MRKAFIAAALILSAPAVRADMTWCVNCATTFTQALQYAREVESVAMQADQKLNEIKMLENMVTNTVNYPKQVWGTLSGDMNSINSLYGRARSLAYQAGNIDSQMTSQYGNYKNYVQSKLDGQTLAQKYQQWSDSSNDSIQTTLKALGLQSDQAQADDAVMRQIQSMSEGAQGHMQAMQAGNQIAAQQVSSIRELQQTMMLGTQMQANYIQQQVDKEALQAAQMRQFTAPVDIPVNTGERF